MQANIDSALDYSGRSRVVNISTTQDGLWNVGYVVTLALINTGFAPNGSQRYFCPVCRQTFNERFDTLYYHRHVAPEQLRQVLQAQARRQQSQRD